MSYFNDRKSMQSIMQKFWQRKIKDILVTANDASEATPAKNNVMEALNLFASKFPEQQIEIEHSTPSQKVNQTRSHDEERIFMTVHFNEWKNDLVKFHIMQNSSEISFYVISDAGLENTVIEAWKWRGRCDFTASLLKVEEFVKNYPKHRKQADKKKDTIIKKEKINEMASKTIETIVPQMMASTNFEWHLERSTYRYTLDVKSANNKMLRISFTLKDFAKKLSSLVNFTTQMNNLLENSLYIVEVRSCDPSLNWKKG